MCVSATDRLPARSASGSVGILGDGAIEGAKHAGALLGKALLEMRALLLG
ncbi:MAG: hypothetical protein ABJE47_15155 [bacterium]